MSDPSASFPNVEITGRITMPCLFDSGESDSGSCYSKQALCHPSHSPVCF